MTFERAGSDNARTINYQCSECGYKITLPLPKRGDREFNGRVPCPKCAAIKARGVPK